MAPGRAVMVAMWLRPLGDVDIGATKAVHCSRLQGLCVQAYRDKLVYGL